MELIHQQKIFQRMIMTPQLKVAIQILQLSRLELIDRINEEIENNPLLEEVKDELTLRDYSNDDPNVASDEVFTDVAFDPHSDYYGTYGEVSLRPIVGRVLGLGSNFNICLKESLNDYLHWQLLLMSLSDEEKRVGSFVIGNLSQDGYLRLKVSEIVEQTRVDGNFVEKVLRIVQSLDPAGVCARNLKECLLIQANRIETGDGLVGKIISTSLAKLKNKNYKAISRSLKVREKDIQAAVGTISSLDPRPGCRFNRGITEYAVPDIYICEDDGSCSITLNDDGLPKLRVNSQYKKALLDDKFDLLAKNYLRDKMHSAVWMIKSIRQRQRTIYKVMKSILHLQKDFFQKGVEHLKPMGLKEVAEDIGMHESTVSRVTNNKYVCTHRGVYELKYFFDNSIKCLQGGAIAAVSVQKKIKRMIEKENPFKPYSDNKISKLLRMENIDIARRTVAKYREKLRIVPSNMRKRF